MGADGCLDHFQLPMHYQNCGKTHRRRHGHHQKRIGQVLGAGQEDLVGALFVTNHQSLDYQDVPSLQLVNTDVRREGL